MSLLLCTASWAVASDPKCEFDRPVRFAGLDWDSDRFHVAVASYVMEKGYGCKTEVLPGSTIPLLTGLINGDLDVMMEIWKDNVTEAWEKGERAGKVALLGINFPDAIQGWFVPRYIVEGEDAPAKGLVHVSDLPKYHDVFLDPEDGEKGRFYNCIYGWGCELINSKKLRAYGLSKYYTNFRPGTSAALSAAVAAAYKRKKPILYYYWAPSWVYGKYDGVMLKEPEYDHETWLKLGKQKRPKKATAYPLVKVYSGANTAFMKKAPKLVAFLRKYRTTTELVSDALVYMQDTKGADTSDAAIHFLKKHYDLWSKWVPDDVAHRIKKSLN